MSLQDFCDRQGEPLDRQEAARKALREAQLDSKMRLFYRSKRRHSHKYVFPRLSPSLCLLHMQLCHTALHPNSYFVKLSDLQLQELLIPRPCSHLQKCHLLVPGARSTEEETPTKPKHKA